MDPKNGVFGRFCPKMGKKQPDQATFWLDRGLQKGSKMGIFARFLDFARGVPGFWQKTAPNNGNLSGTFSGFAGKRALKIDFLGWTPPKSQILGHFDPKKGFCHQTSIKRLHLRHIDIVLVGILCAMQWIQVANRSSAAKGFELS